jgi:penicillin-binding protein-related factor A (putative recombinase)
MNNGRPLLNAAKRNAGHVFEDDIERVAAQYQFHKHLRVKKVDPPSKVLRPPGRGPIVIFLDNPFLDFCGTWTERGGRAVFFEAKSTTEPRLAINVQKGASGLKETQVDAMRHWRSAGAVTFLLWQHAGEVRLVCIEEITNTLNMGVKSLKWGACDSYPCPQGTGFVLFDFLQIMRKIWPAS